MALTQYTLQYLIVILPICIICGIVYIRNTRQSAIKSQYSYRYSEQLVREKLVAANGTNNLPRLYINLIVLRFPLLIAVSWDNSYNIHIFRVTGSVTCNCGRGTTTALEVILCCIVLWLMLIRPMILFIWSPEHLFDLGSHILLSVTAVFAPILPQQKLTRQVSIFRIDPTTANLPTSKEQSDHSDGA